jgi:hypothetical protein
MGIRRLYAICHVDHDASRRVMEKCGLTREGVLSRHTVFPNLGPGACDVLCYSIPLLVVRIVRDVRNVRTFGRSRRRTSGVSFSVPRATELMNLVQLTNAFVSAAVPVAG